MQKLADEQRRLGRALVNVTRNELRVDGVAVNVPPRAFLVLTALMEAGGANVTKEELLRRAWGAEFVDESNLTQAVARLRKLLDPPAEGESHIITVPRIGYRLGVPMETEPAAAIRPPRRWLAFAGLAVVASLAFLGLTASRGPSPAAEFSAPEPFSSWDGDEWNPSVSPDGRTLAFASNAGPTDQTDLYLIDIATRQRRLLLGGPTIDVSPAFSPDGRQIAFLRISGATALVMLMSAAGGHEEAVAEIPAPHHALYGSPGPHVAWSANGKALLFADRNRAGDPSGIYRLTLADRKKRQLTMPPTSAARGDAEPAMSPDGRTLVFARDVASGVSDLWSVAFDERGEPRGPETPLLANRHWNRSPVWTPDGRAIVFTSGDWGRIRLWQLPMPVGMPAVPMPGAGEDGWQPTFSRATGDLYYVRHWQSRHVWRWSLRTPGEPQGTPTPVLQSPALDIAPSESPDGRELIFESRRTGRQMVWRSSVNGESPRPFIELPDSVTGSGRWSPDGRSVAFDGLRNGQRDIFLADADGSRVRPLTDSPTEDVMPRWSADSQRVYFASRRTGRPEIWKSAVTGGAPVQVTRNGGYLGEEAPGRPGIYFVRTDDRLRPLYWTDGTGEDRLVLPSVLERNFAVTPEGIYFLSGLAAEPGIRFYAFRDGRMRLVGNPVPPVRSHLSVSVDGKRLYYGVQGGRNADVLVARRIRRP